MYDLAIIGGGPAGASAGVYAARKKLKTVFITKDFGGQSIVAHDIQNWLGTISMSGAEFGKMVRRHVESYSDDVLEIKEGKYARLIEKTKQGFLIKTEDEGTYEARTLLICTGGKRRKLNVPGADKFEHKGITYCATCDGPLFKDQDVAVIGGGNAGFGTASQLIPYAKNITIIECGHQFMADPLRVEEVLKEPKIKALKNIEIKEITGEKMVNGLICKDRETGEQKELQVTGIFVEIGMTPATEAVRDLVELNECGYIIIDHKNQQTTTENVWAAGDCTDSLYKQNIIAAGAGAKAVEDIYQKLKLS